MSLESSNGDEREDTKTFLLRRADQVDKHVKRYWWVLSTVGVLLTVGFSVGTYLFLNFARTSDVEALHEQIRQHTGAVHEIKTDVAVLKASSDRIEKSVNRLEGAFMRAQSTIGPARAQR